MNAFQEIILDRLVGADRSDFKEPRGTLRLAFRALVDAHLINERFTPTELGYPLIFIQVLEAACSMLAEEDKRQLAITIFAEVAPRCEVHGVTSRCYVASALWSARRVHPLICGAECPYLQNATEQIDQYLSSQRVADILFKVAKDKEYVCKASNDVIADPLHQSLIRIRTLVRRTIENLLKAAQEDRNRQSPEQTSAEGCANAGRLAAHFKGVQGAADFCMGFARELGM